MFYAIDKWGCVHFGNSPIEALKKVREAEADGISSGLDGVLGVGTGVETEELKQEKRKKLNNFFKHKEGR